MKSTVELVKKNPEHPGDLCTYQYIYLYFTTIRGKCWGTKCFERMQEVMTSVKLEREGLSRQLVDMQRQQAGKTRELRDLEGLKDSNNSPAELKPLLEVGKGVK